jgi:uncharacterized protein YjcR
MPWWTETDKQKAIDLAVATTAANAARQTGIPAGTIRRWLAERRLTNGTLKSERSKTVTKSEHFPEGKNEHSGNEHIKNEQPAARSGSQRSSDQLQPTKPASNERRQCAAISHKTGERCKKPAMPGSPFCHIHTDGWEGQCTARSKQTGQRCKKKAVPGKRVCKFHGANGGVPPGRGIQNNLKHGFFSKIFPDDEETMALVKEIIEKSPLDILWENIMIQYLVIARAQKIAWVKNRDDLTRVLVRERNKLSERSSESEREWEIQQAWDKYNAFLANQSRAMNSLERLIARYEELLQAGRGSEEHKLRLEKLKQDMDIARERLELERAKIERGDDPGRGNAWADLAAGEDDDESEES